MTIVLDASIAIAWVYKEENTEAILRVFDQLKKKGAYVPSLWRWEVANILQANVRRGRHGGDLRDEALAALAMFSIAVDSESDQQAWLDAVLLAERHGLTLYDASYLEIAVRRKIPLATLDQELRAAAESDGVELLAM